MWGKPVGFCNNLSKKDYLQQENCRDEKNTEGQKKGIKHNREQVNPYKKV